MHLPRAIICALGLAAGGAASARAAEAPSPEALKYFTREDVERGAKRARQARVLWAASFVWTLAVLVALAHPRVGGLFVGAARRMVGLDGGTPGWRAYAAAALTIAMLIGAYLALRAPFVWARGYFFEHAWGLSVQGPGAFLWDWVRAALLTTVLYTVSLGAVVILRAKLPHWWPVAAWGAVSAFIVLMVFVHPIVIDPIFNRFTPVEEPEVRERAARIAERAGVRVGEVLWMDASRRTKRTNAYFTGLGATKRIVLYDTLRGKSDEGGKAVDIPPGRLDEMETILAHEAGHWRHGHMWKGTLLALAGTGAFFLGLWLLAKVPSSWIPAGGLPGGARAAVGVLLAATVVNFLAMPVANAVSRSWERAADRASLEYSRNPEAFIRAEVELSRRNISQIEPGALVVFWFYTHPPVLERIRMAEDYADAARPERE
ncbi:MAG: M48 family metallopeptidase [Planctomycetota bacterium]